MLLRVISLPTHGALELAVALAVAIGPIALGLDPAGVLIAVFVGALMAGLAINAGAPRGPGSLPVSAHASYDKLLALALLLIGVAAGLLGYTGALVFFAAASAVHAVLIAATRYTAAA